MAAPIRITAPLLDVLECLVLGWQRGEEQYGWSMMKAVGRSGPTVYGVLDRLEDADWIVGRWDDAPEPGPRRRFYRLTPDGYAHAEQILAGRARVAGRTPARPSFGLSMRRIHLRGAL
jgi:PadR family transcriptional regulator PadR